LIQNQTFNYHHVNIILNDVSVILFFDSNTTEIYDINFNLILTLPFINITPANVHDKVATYLLFQ
jgi:hypothetical protein